MSTVVLVIAPTALSNRLKLIFPAIKDAKPPETERAMDAAFKFDSEFGTFELRRRRDGDGVCADIVERLNNITTTNNAGRALAQAVDR